MTLTNSISSLEKERQAVSSEIDTAQPLPPTFPDGGAVAWIQVVMGFLLMFSSWGIVTCFGVFQSYYETVSSLSSASSISWIGSSQACLLLFCGALCGRLMDAGYARSLTAVGSFLIILGIFCTSVSGLSPSSGKEDLVYWQILLSQGICEGLGMACIFLPSVGIPATYFGRRRTLATGIVTTGASIGGIIYPILFEQVLARAGIRWAMRAVGFLAIVTLVPACLMVRQRTDLPRKAKGPLLELQALKEPSYLALVIGQSFSFMGVYIVYDYIQTGINYAGVDLHGMKSFYIISIINAGGFFGRLVPNYVADKTAAPLFVQATVVFTTAILIFVWPSVLNLPGLIIFSLLYGFFSGGFTSLPPASVASLTPDMSRFGARLGLAVTFNGFGVLAGPPIAGAIIGDGNGYTHAGIFGGLVVLIGAVGVCIAGVLRLKLAH